MIVIVIFIVICPSKRVFLRVIRVIKPFNSQKMTKITTNHDNSVAVIIFPKNVDKKGLFEGLLAVRDHDCDRPSPLRPFVTLK